MVNMVTWSFLPLACRIRSTRNIFLLVNTNANLENFLRGDFKLFSIHGKFDCTSPLLSVNDYESTGKMTIYSNQWH